jgi:hypothetical protein
MLLTIDEVIAEINSGKNLLLAGDELLLRQLPRGSWIGGTIPYFMAQEGGVITKEKVFTTILPADFELTEIKLYDRTHIAKIAKEAPENGCSFIIVPANSDIHLQYAKEAPNYPELFLKPIVGWIAGIHLDDAGATPKVFDGSQATESQDQAVVMHTRLPPSIIPEIGIINLFEQGDGDTITFPNTGFSATTCYVNGKEWNLAEYIEEKGISTVPPLVADYFGAQINVSFKAIDKKNGTVDFYAPVFSGIEYKAARPVQDYIAEFQSALKGLEQEITFSCNCILNFLYSELEGKKTGSVEGPITFGEIAYQLLNQTMVYLVLHRSE